MRLIFMGTSEFSVAALDRLYKAGHDIVCVYTQPPRPAGRGKKERCSPVHIRANFLELMVRHPTSFQSQDDQKAFSALHADVAVVAAYGLILPQTILDAPTLGCLNIHASLLPRWRGAAPIHRAIMAGDQETGVCIMQMLAGLDNGPILLKKTLPIEANSTTATLHDHLAEIGASLIALALEDLSALPSNPQSNVGVTYAKKIKKQEAFIDWSQSAEEVDRKIRGLSPFPGAWFEHKGVRIKVLESQLNQASGVSGLVLDDALTVACQPEAVQLMRLQKAGRESQETQDFLRGNPLPPGTILN